MKKLSELGYVSLVTFPGRHGTAIYLENYLSTMFQISDVKVDKAKVALCLNIKIKAPLKANTSKENAAATSQEEQSCVSPEPVIVSKPDVDIIIDKALKVLKTQGVSCIGCGRSKYKLYPLYDCKGKIEAGAIGHEGLCYRLKISCGGRGPIYTFDLTITEAEGRGRGYGDHPPPAGQQGKCGDNAKVVRTQYAFCHACHQCADNTEITRK